MTIDGSVMMTVACLAQAGLIAWPLMLWWQVTTVRRLKARGDEMAAAIDKRNALAAAAAAERWRLAKGG